MSPGRRPPRLSVCLIARDEEALLPGCLASVTGVADEVVVVDTGSSDRTCQLAAAAGATLLRTTWAEDFSAPRNLAARSATGDWLLVLDADERLAPADLGALHRRLEAADFDVGMVRLHNASRLEASAAEVVSGAARLGSPVLLPRLIRNQGRPEWRGVIHENVGEWLLQRGGRRGLVDLDLVHLGALASVRRSKDKAERNVTLLRRRLEAEPGDVTPVGYLALELIDLGQLEEADAALERAWPLVGSQPAWRCLHRLGVARGLLALRHGLGDRAVETASLAAARNGPHPDWAYLLGAGLDLQGQGLPPGSPGRSARLAEAALALRQAAGLLAGGGPFDFLALAQETRCQLHLGAVELQRGLAAEATQAFEAALRLEPENGLARLGAAEALVLSGQPARALEAVEPLLGAAPDGWIVAALAAARLGAAGDARLFLAQARRRLTAGLGSGHRAGLMDALAGELAVAAHPSAGAPP